MQIMEIVKKSIESSDHGLGDRTGYVGSSDIGGCLRKAYLRKTDPRPHSLESLIRMKRGHMVEQIIHDGLAKAGLTFHYQLEARYPEREYYRAHIDFVFGGKDLSKAKEIAVLECKSVEDMPSQPYPEWVNQTHWQMGLLASAYPNAHVRGGILVMNVSDGGMRVFNGMSYQPEVFDALIGRGEKLWKAMQQNSEQNLPTEQGPLCSYCSHRPGCPRFDVEGAVNLDPISSDVERFLAAKMTIKEADRERKASSKVIVGYLRDQLRGIYGDTPLKKVAVKPKKVFDEKAFQKDHSDLYERYLIKEKEGYCYIDV